MPSADVPRPDQHDNAPTATIGAGGETHQVVDGGGSARLTSAQGMPVADDQNTLRVGPRGPAALADAHMREKIFHFDHERIPERVVHARGYGAHGYFENYESLSGITRADLFQVANTKTPAFVRFSTVAGSEGSPDLARDVRGFAVKLYTQEGNWDIVGNNIPVFFIQDAMKFPDLVHAAKPEPDRGFPQAQTAHDNFWDFVSLMPETTHMLLWVMSDRAIPRSLRFMEGFGVHTFRMVDHEGQSTYVKFHWKPVDGMQSVVWNEAVKINGADPDFHRRDMWDAIQQGNFPQWELGLQLFDDEFADQFDFDILDATKLIPEELVPIRKVGKLVLDRVVDNFFAETEQVAFCTQNIVPGIDFTNDPLLQGRNFSYLDTQLKRLGSPNFTNIPVNAPKCPFANFQRDGHMTMQVPTGRANFEPNSWSIAERGPREDPEHGFVSFPAGETGELRRVRAESFADHYSQAAQFYISQTAVEQQHIAAAFAFELSKVERPDIRMRMVANLRNVDDHLAQAVADGIGMPTLPDASSAAAPTIALAASPALSMLANPAATLRGRKFGVLITNGADADLLQNLSSAATVQGANMELIAPRVEGIQLSDGSLPTIAQQIAGGPSVLYDCVVIAATEQGAGELEHDGPTRDFIADAYAHCKFIGHTAASNALLVAAGVELGADAAVALLSDEASINGFVEACAALRYFERFPPHA